MSIGDNIRIKRKEMGLSQKELANALHLSQSVIAGYESDQRKPSYDVLAALSDFFGVSQSYLLTGIEDDNIELPQTKRVPLLGDVAAGQPLYCEENVDEYVDCPDSKADFALRIKGSSMEPTFHTGDIVFFKETETADDGKIVAFVFDGERATVKRMKHNGDDLCLCGDNPLFPSIVVKPEQLAAVRIIGVATSFFAEL